MVKAYVLLNNDNNIYFPVKASTNPYNGGATYCAGSPQFFGGRVGHETQRAALLREVAEESQLTYLADNRPMIQLYQAVVGPPDTGEDYYFYSTNEWRQPAQHQWPPDLNNWRLYPPAFREMCCIVQTPIAGLVTALGLTPGTMPDVAPWQLPGLPALAAALVNAARAGAPDWALPQIPDAPTEDFLNSETLIAFACFLVNTL